MENDEAKVFIRDVTGLSEKKTVGTRVIIMNPKEEICESISSGEIISYIQESWWRCIEKMPKDSGIFINGSRVNMPVLGPFDHDYQISKPEVYTSGYRIKKFGFFINSKNSKRKDVSVSIRKNVLGSNWAHHNNAIL